MRTTKIFFSAFVSESHGYWGKNGSRSYFDLCYPVALASFTDNIICFSIYVIIVRKNKTLPRNITL
ncbi:hypothetical protein RhiirA1_86193 [Rhizophagus irregularis]|uniref:Uncharacterized protein n=1 Tax=Rhizophagus irregularis TaxID=588596 RepID=A0A2N0R198_9GLOM|nr:hypothetical protein RhiirA1_86193 [Rhizophagus irregularis]